MASGFTVSGRGDLDALFYARASAARAAVGYQVAGVDIAQRYEQIGGAAAIAATGLLSVGTDLASLFLGISSLSAALQVASYLNSTSSGASLSWNSDGTFTRNANTSGANYTWLTAGTAAQCEIMVTPTAGSFTAGTVSTWLSLATSRAFTQTAAAAASKSVTFNVQIRAASGGAILATANGCTLTNDRT